MTEFLSITFAIISVVLLAMGILKVWDKISDSLFTRSYYRKSRLDEFNCLEFEKELTVNPDRQYFYNSIDYELDSDIRPLLRNFLLFLNVLWIVGGIGALINTTELFSFEFVKNLIFLSVGILGFYSYYLRPFLLKRQIYEANDHSLRHHGQHTILFNHRGVKITDIDGFKEFYSWARINKIVAYKKRAIFLEVSDFNFILQIPQDLFPNKNSVRELIAQAENYQRKILRKSNE
jgi:hypothetical protein